MIWPQDIHNEICTRALTVMRDKSADYTGGDDPYRNFRLIEALSIGSMEQGIIVRMSDKLSRLAKFSKDPDLVVTDECIEDTLIDLVNYSVILAAAWRERSRLYAEAEAYKLDLGG